MSMLLGPLSDTMSSTSWRVCAFAGDQTAGAVGNTPPAATAVTDFKNSRRFITALRLRTHIPFEKFRKGRATPGRSRDRRQRAELIGGLAGYRAAWQNESSGCL